MAATTVTGTEIARAQGEAATSTTRARSIQVAGSPSLLVAVSSVSTVPTTTVSFDDYEASTIG